MLQGLDDIGYFVVMPAELELLYVHVLVRGAEHVVVVVIVVVDGVSLSLNPRDMAVFSKSVYKH